MNSSHFQPIHGHASRGQKKSATYRAWEGMRRRCNRPAAPEYPYYGGRGIKVCERWDTFANFLADMGEKPAGLTLDRKDSNDHYCPENCRWATQADQNRNKSGLRMITHQGRTQTLSAWCRELNLPYDRMRYRLACMGWSPEKAFSEPSCTERHA